MILIFWFFSFIYCFQKTVYKITNKNVFIKTVSTWKIRTFPFPSTRLNPAVSAWLYTLFPWNFFFWWNSIFMIQNSRPAPSVSQYTAANKSKLKIQVLICCAGHWEIKLLLIDWTFLVCACWNLIKRRPWKVTVDNSIRVKQVEPKLVYLGGLFRLQRVFSWMGTHSCGFVQFPSPSLQARWVYHIW